MNKSAAGSVARQVLERAKESNGAPAFTPAQIEAIVAAIASAIHKYDSLTPR